MLVTDKGMEKACPDCGNVDKAHEGHVTPSSAIILKFRCSKCGRSHQRGVEAPEVKVEAFVGFTRKPYRWEPKP